MSNYQNDDRMMDNELADFTDRIMDKKPGDARDPFAPDPELRALQQTALRLKNAFGQDGPSPAATHRMRQNIITRWKQQEKTINNPYWKKFLSVSGVRGQKWQSQQSRQRQSLYVLLAMLVLIMVASIPLLSTTGSSQPAASGQNLGISVLVVFGGLFLLAAWYFRRKL